MTVDGSLGKGLTHALRLLRRGVFLDLHVCRPARVVLVHPATASGYVTVDVEPAFLPVVGGNTPQTAAVEVVAPPKIMPGVPVAFPVGAAGGLTWGVAPGDTGMLVFADRSLERWKLAGTASDPGAAHAHAQADAVFLPGLRSLASPPLPVDATATVVHATAALRLGAAAVAPVARVGDTLSPSAQLTAWAVAVEAALVAAGAAVPPAASWGVTMGAPGALGTIATGSAKVSAE